MPIIDLLKLVRSDVVVRLSRTEGMEFYANGVKVTDKVRGLDFAYVAELDRLITEPSCP